ncbi:hypothetical protein [Arthrobacter sp. STN4]|nr:hypothetical protein [Arthrobacter sp. STN4]
MNKFDPDSKLIEIVAASDRHPDPNDREPQRFSLLATTPRPSP